MRDTWTDIPGYGGKYQADRDGCIRRIYASGKTRQMTPYRRKMHGNAFFVKLTKDGKGKAENLAKIMALTFIGPRPSGHVPYHKNKCQTDNRADNIEYISTKELGRLTGMDSRRQPVAKIDKHGQIVCVYRSAREAARQNYMSYQTVIDRCNGKCKGAFAPDGYAYAWDDNEVSMKQAIEKINKETGSKVKAGYAKYYL